MKDMRQNFILLTLLLDGIGVGIVFPMMPDLMERVGAGSTAAGSVWGGIMMSAYALMLFLCGPVVGSLSDRYGRRPVLLGALAALTVDYVIMALASTYWMLLLGRVLAGIAGSTYGTATAYLSDISSAEEKAARFGLVGAAFGIGFVIGPVIGGLAAGVHVTLPFWIAAVVAGLAVLVGVFVLPESLPPEKRRAIKPADFNPFAAILNISRLPGLGVPLAVIFVFECANMVYPTLWAFWSREMFGWDAALIGLSLSVYGVGIALTQGVLMGRLIPRFGEYRTLWVAVLAGLVAALAYSVTTAGWLVFVLMIPACLSDMAPPLLSALSANRVSDDQQGVLQGVIMSFGAIAAAVAPLLMTGLFRVFADDQGLYLPGAPFLLTALLIAAVLPLLRRLQQG